MDAMNYLKHLMWRKNISYADLGHCLGVYPSTISNKLNGKYPFTLGEVRAIARYLHLGTDEIYKAFFI